jgi:hypothetical protein
MPSCADKPEVVKNLLMTFVSCAFCAFCLSALADIGDSESKVDASYGKRIERRIRDKNGTETVQLENGGTISSLYEKGDHVIMVVFEGGKSVFEMYGRQDGQPITPEDSFRFMKANEAGVGWRQPNPKEPMFERADHQVIAEFRDMGGRPSLIVRVVHKKS